MPYCTVSNNLALFVSEPDVAVTKIDVVEGGGGGVLEVDPHPVNKPTPTMLAVSKSNICKLRRLLKPKKQNAIASAAPGNSGLES
jgi:hypothetical protein